MKTSRYKNSMGISLLEVLIAMTMGLIVMSGVISALMVAKNYFITQTAISGLQENARYALKLITEELRMAGYSSCPKKLLKQANIINAHQNTWYVNGVGIQGFEQFNSDSGRVAFPKEFSARAEQHSDAIVIRRGQQSNLQVASDYPDAATIIPLNKNHDIEKGEVLMIVSPDCQQLAYFQMGTLGGSSNDANTLPYIPQNPHTTTGNTVSQSYPPGSSIMRLKSTAFYIGRSVFSDSPALFQEFLTVSRQAAVTRSQELVQGIENMQISYGLDLSGDDGAVDIYLDANAAAMDWNKVVCIRLNLRLRSLYPVYSKPQVYGKFMGIDDTNGSDRFLRQQITTTVQLRNH